MLDDIFAAVLVGGRGVRMGGVDKARLRPPGARTSLLERTVSLLRPHMREVVLAGRAEQSYPEVACRLIADRRPGLGPLAGLEAALLAKVAPWCLLVACDMPALSEESIFWLARARTGGHRVITPLSARGLEPTFALYHTSCAGAVTAALDRGVRALHRFIRSQGHRALPIPAELDACFANVND